MALSKIPLKSDVFAPLHLRYASRNHVQPASLTLDENGEVRFYINTDIDSNIPFSVYHKCVFQWRVTLTMTVKEANELIDEIMPLLERVHAGHMVEFDGRNMVGRLDDDAQEAFNAVEDACSRAEGSISIMNPDDWIFPDGVLAGAEDVGLTADTTDSEIEDLAQGCIEAANFEGTHLDGDVVTCLQKARDILKEEHEAKGPSF